MSLELIESKIKIDGFNKLTEKEIDEFIDKHWLEYTCRYNLSPCGDLTLKGKREYLQANIDEVIEIIEQFPVEDENE